MNSRLILSVWLIMITAAAALPTRAAEKIDLERITPVPADQPVPVQDFFRPAMLLNPQPNEAGTHVAARVIISEDKYALLVHDLATQKFETLKGVGDRDIYGFDWLSDSRIMFSLAKEKLFGEGVYVAEIGKLGQAYPVIEWAIATLVGVPENDRAQPLLWMRRDIEDGNGLQGQVFKVNANLDLRAGLNRRGEDDDTAVATRARNRRHYVKTYPAPKGGLVWRYLPDKDGELAFALTARDGISTLHRLAGGLWEKCPVDLDVYDVESYGEKPGEIVVLGPPLDGKPRVLSFMDATTGQLGEVLLADKGYDFDGWMYRHPGTHQILGLNFQRNGPKTVWFAEAYRGIQKILDGFFPGLVVVIIGSDKAEKNFFVAVFSDREPVKYFQIDLEKRSVGLFKATAPWIDPKRMQPMSMLKYKTADGRQLDAYVTLPAGASKEKPAPLVVLPHGGPWVRDVWGFNGEAQFLASRGYAVLQPNYRGSTGYDWMFPYEDRWAFRKMHDDVTAATRTLLASGLIDRNRVAIMGASFGAYLALSGVAHEPELYRCAVTIAGVFDWERVLQDEKYEQFDNPQFGVLRRRLGDPKAQKEKFDEISPLRHVDQVRVPLFVAHGKADQTASVAESRRLVDELEKHKVPHEVMFVSGEGHGMGHLKNQVELYTRIAAFLEKNLVPTTAAIATP